MRTLAGSIGFLASTSALLAASSSAQTTTRASVSTSGVQANMASTETSISANGRFVAFRTTAWNLDPGDSNGLSDIYVRDLATGTTTRASLQSFDQEFDESSITPSISGDGRFVAFVVFPNMDLSQIHVRDRQGATTALVSATPGGNPGNGHSGSPVISADGRFVAFHSGASDLVPGDTNGESDCFVRDLVAGTTVIASLSSAGAQSNGATLFGPPSISGDGRLAVFVTEASNLVAGDVNLRPDIFVRDLQAGTTTRIQVGDFPDSSIIQPVISSDGRWIAFHSVMALVPEDTNGTLDVYLHDRQDGTTRRISLDSADAQVAGTSREASISADGRFVAFKSDATALVPGDTNGVVDVFVRDVLHGTTTRASVSSLGLEGHGVSSRASISGDGRVVAFQSLANDLVGDDTNGVEDVFAIDRTCTGAISTYCVAKTNGLGCVPAIGSTGMPSLGGPDDFFVTAQDVRNRKLGMLLWSLTPDDRPFGGGTLCLHSTIRRTPGQNSGGSPTGDDCTGTYSFHFSQAYMAARNLPAHTTIHAQYWSRDPGFAFPDNIGLTDALRFTICE